MKVKEFVQIKNDYQWKRNVPKEIRVSRKLTFSNVPVPRKKYNGRHFTPVQRKVFQLILMGKDPKKAVEQSYHGRINVNQILNSPRIQELISSADKIKMAIAMEQLPNIVEMLNVFLTAARNQNLRSADKVEAASKYLNYFRDILPKKEINTQINVYNEYKNLSDEELNEKLREIIEREKTIDVEYSETEKE